MKNLLFIGDVVGAGGCRFLSEKLPGVKRKFDISVTIVNGENSAKGNGITPASAEFLLRAGADAVTTGNHVFRRREIYPLLESSDTVLRPANYPDGVCGKGWCMLDMGSYSVAVVNLMGTSFMDALDNPFTVIDDILPKIDTPNIFLDFHAEATSEKKAMGHYLTGQVTGVFGTHTHVQTADEIILGGHTAYITDAGMTGAEISCLGDEIEPVLEHFRFHMPVRFKESDSACFMCGAAVSFDEKNGEAKSIERIMIR